MVCASRVHNRLPMISKGFNGPLNNKMEHAYFNHEFALSIKLLDVQLYPSHLQFC